MTTSCFIFPPTFPAEVQNYLTFATESRLHQISLDTPTLADISAHFPNFLDVSSISVDILHDQVYWAERVESKIFSAPLSSFVSGGTGGLDGPTGAPPQVVVSNDIMSPEAVVVDWIGRMLYWADSGTGTIEVMNLENRARKILVEDLMQVTSLALDLVSR